MWSGILNLHKPAGITSAAAVGRVKRLLPRGTKVGHAGTLDPFATGVLLVLVGRATKSCESLMGAVKEYEATIKLDATTPSLDPETPEAAVAVVTPPTPEAVLAAMARQIGVIEQMPPTYSALKINGRRAADRHRDGETVVLRPRPVRIDAFDLLDYAWPLARVHVTCGRGTYVRAIARDLGVALGTGGYLTQLCRTRVGEYLVGDALTLDGLDAARVEQSLGGQWQAG
ncbi:MAG TPA: tRNA pseudouridine(55) synthase TruB [Tepidisphaeraceae bacterium]